MNRLLIIERALRVPLDWSRGPTSAAANLLRVAHDDHEYFLNVIDAVLREFALPDAADSLNAVLEHGGSVWKVEWISGRAGLERRVDATIARAAEHAISASGKAGEHLKTAWHSAYGRDPNPTQTYWESIRAVEAAGKPVVSPSNANTTLGTMINDLAAAPTKWTVTLKPKPGVEPVEVLIGMMRLLWKSHTDRHGDPNAIRISQPEASAAVHLAVTLVQWFSDGSVSRK